MSSEFINKILDMHDKATKSQKILIEFLANAKLEVLIYLSITELAELTGVGEATIIRFCRSMGFEGYQEFKLVMAQSLMPSRRGGENIYSDIIADNMIETIKHCKDTVNVAAIEAAVDTLISSKRISIFGVGNSYVAALELHNKLMKIGILSYLENGAHMQNMLCASFTQDDTVVFFSVSGCTVDTLEAAELAKKNGCRIIVITSYDKSPLAKLANIVLSCIKKESPLDAGSMLTKLVQLYMVDVLVTGISKRDIAKYSDIAQNVNISVVKKLL